MKLLIFGATRGVGAELTRQSLARGHSVHAFARTASAVAAGATAVAGDVLDRAAVESAVRAAAPDAVLLALGGAGIWSRDFVCSAGTENVLAALKACGLGSARIVCCTSMGVGDSAPLIPGFVRWLLKHPLADKEPQEAGLRASGHPHVIVRPTGLRDDPARGRAALAALQGEKLPTSRIARADVAAFMLDCLAADDFLNKTVGISWLTV